MGRNLRILSSAIVSSPGAYYFDLHTVLNGGGVARGQLTVAVSQ